VEDEENSVDIADTNNELSLNDIITKPRFTVSHHTLRRKNLDNSLDDYGIYDIVDESGYNEYLSIFKGFLKEEYLKQSGKILTQLKSSFKGIIEKSFDNLRLNEFQNGINEIDEDKRGRRSDSCLFACFQSKKKKLDSNHNFTSLVQDLSKSLKEIKRNSKKNLIDDNYFVKEEFSHLKKESVNNVISDIVQTNKVTVRLKDDVDRFAEYFNIKKIVEKQENKIKVQKKSSMT